MLTDAERRDILHRLFGRTIHEVKVEKALRAYKKSKAKELIFVKHYELQKIQYLAQQGFMDG